MQRRLPHARVGNGTDLRLDVDILSVATANPAYRIDQREAWERARVSFPHLARMEALFANTGIATRYSCVPADWCETPHGWEERTATYHNATRSTYCSGYLSKPSPRQVCCSKTSIFWC